MSLATCTVAFWLFFEAQSATAFLTASVSVSPEEPISTVRPLELSSVRPPDLASEELSSNPLPPQPASMVSTAREAAVTTVSFLLIIEFLSQRVRRAPRMVPRDGAPDVACIF